MIMNQESLTTHNLSVHKGIAINYFDTKKCFVKWERAISTCTYVRNKSGGRVYFDVIVELMVIVVPSNSKFIRDRVCFV